MYIPKLPKNGIIKKIKTDTKMYLLTLIRKDGGFVKKVTAGNKALHSEEKEVVLIVQMFL